MSERNLPNESDELEDSLQGLDYYIDGIQA
jgi:hypothetical protein